MHNFLIKDPTLVVITSEVCKFKSCRLRIFNSLSALVKSTRLGVALCSALSSFHHNHNIYQGSVRWKGKVHPCTGRTAHRGNRGVALLFLGHGTRRGWVVSFTPRPLFIPGKDPLPIVQEAGWAPGPVWTGAENLALHRDSVPGPSSP